MTDPVTGIQGARVVTGGDAKGGGASSEHKKKRQSAPQGDVVDISTEARKKNTPPPKGVLEYLLDLADRLLKPGK